MSKFIDKIEAQLTGRNNAVYGPIKTELLTTEISIDSFNIDNPLITREYKIGVGWYQKVSCRPEDLKHVLKNVVSELTEEIYGDLRNRIIRLERAMYEYDINKMRMVIRDIIREIS